MLPDGGMPQAAAVDVDAAREAAGVASDADPLELENTPENNLFSFSAFFALRDVSTPVENPVRSAVDHGQISAYAAHPYVSDDAVTLVATSQPFDEIASSLEDAGFERDGDVLTIDGDPEELTYTAAARGDGFLALGYSADAVRAVAEGDAEPSTTGELEELAELDAPVRLAVVPDEPECVTAITATDEATDSAELGFEIADGADLERFGPLDQASAASIGFELGEPELEGDTITVPLVKDPGGSGLVNSPAALVGSLLLEPAQIYDCR